MKLKTNFACRIANTFNHIFCIFYANLNLCPSWHGMCWVLATKIFGEEMDNYLRVTIHNQPVEYFPCSYLKSLCESP